MSITHDHGAVQAIVSCLTGRYDFDFSRDEIIFFNIILFLEQVEQIGLDRILFDILCRNGGNKYIQCFPFHNLVCCLAHLSSSQMNQQVGDTYNRIVVIITDIDINDCTVLFHNNTSQCHRTGNPLIFLDTAIIMGIHQAKTIGFI